MKNLTGILGLTVGVAAVATALFYRKKDGSRIADNLWDSAKEAGNSLMRNANNLKDRLLNNINGPNGEPVYLDMYDRQFYEDPQGNRIYLQNA